MSDSRTYARHFNPDHEGDGVPGRRVTRSRSKKRCPGCYLPLEDCLGEDGLCLPLEDEDLL